MKTTVELRNFIAAYASEVGPVRERNEDSVGYFDTINGHVFVVCDGVGGASSGDLASAETVKCIGDYFAKEWNENPLQALKKAITECNKKICGIAKKQPNLRGMGTTVVLALFRENKIFYAHAGDSRIYFISGQNIFQLTKDHSFVQEMIDKELITKEEAANHPRKNEITNAIGISKEVKADVCEKQLTPKDDDYLLLCSDGFSSFVGEEEIPEALNLDENIDSKVKNLIEKAIINGSDDNITVLLIRFYNTGNHEKPSDEEIPQKQVSGGRNGRVIISVFFTILVIYLWSNFHTEAPPDREIKSKPPQAKINITIKQDGDTIVNIFYRTAYEKWAVLNKYNMQSRPDEKGRVYQPIAIQARTQVSIKVGESYAAISRLYGIRAEKLAQYDCSGKLYLKAGKELCVPE